MEALLKLVSLAMVSLFAVGGQIALASDGSAHAHHAKARRHGKSPRHKRSVRHPSAPGSSSAEPAGPTVCAGATDAPVAANLAEIRSALLCLVNHERASRGLAALRENGALTRAAQAHTDDMVAHNYFDHTGPAGDTPYQRIFGAGYAGSNDSYAIGENIALGTGDEGQPINIVAAWMDSPGHRENILDPKYREAGMGVAAAVPASESVGGQPGMTVTNTFGVHG
ncbi:MAG TPA: CAP domain-containing protein [Solirubrobacteraceae bacterium]|nr:CAP domain-containing protein [Solirubrobacteraceae bacterium]